MKFKCQLSGVTWSASTINNATSDAFAGWIPHPIFKLSFREALKHQREVGYHLILIHMLLETGLVKEFTSPLLHTPESLPNPNLWHIALATLTEQLGKQINAIKMNKNRLPEIRIYPETNYQTIIDWANTVFYRLAELQEDDRKVKNQIFIASIDHSKSIDLIKANHEASAQIINRVMHNKQGREQVLGLCGIEGNETPTQLEQLVVQGLERKDSLLYWVAKWLQEEENKKLASLHNISDSLASAEKKPRTLAEILASRNAK